MAMPMISECYSPSLKEKVKSSMCCFGASACGGGGQDQHQILEPEDYLRKPRSPYSWLKSTAQDLEIRDRCMGLIGRKGKNRKRHNSADFRYDPASYTLNFEDDANRDDEVPLNNFTARLPATPERLQAEKWTREPAVERLPARELYGWS